MNYKNIKFEPDNLPPLIDAKIYTAYTIDGYSAGEIKNYDFDPTGSSHIVIAETPITIPIKQVTDIKKKVIEALEAEKQKQRAEFHKRMTELQERIDSLLCLEYQPSDNVVDFVCPK